MRKRRRASGFSLLEVVVVLSLTFIFLAISVPIVQGTLQSYRLNSAVSAARGAIQTTRFEAIMRAFPYAITFDPATGSYQVSSRPPGAGGFSNVGGPIPLPGAGRLVIDQLTTLEFQPNGLVRATAGTLIFSLSSTAGTKTITVSRYGHIRVRP